MRTYSPAQVQCIKFMVLGFLVFILSCAYLLHRVNQQWSDAYQFGRSEAARETQSDYSPARVRYDEYQKTKIGFHVIYLNILLGGSGVAIFLMSKDGLSEAGKRLKDTGPVRA
jgi:hypothetical protein